MSVLTHVSLPVTFGSGGNDLGFDTSRSVLSRRTNMISHQPHARNRWSIEEGLTATNPLPAEFRDTLG
jgi:hypothetical protein